MSLIPDCINSLYTGAQGLLSRSRNAWEAACEAWKEAPATEIPSQTPKIVIGNQKEAMERGQCMANESCNDLRLVLWTDASGGNRRSGAGWAFAFREGFTWVRIAAKGPGGRGTNFLELMAISFALDYTIQIVERQTESEKNQLQTLEIYTDSQGALSLLGRMQSVLNVDLIEPDYMMSNQRRKKKAWRKRLDNVAVREMGLKIKKLQEAGVEVELHWVPRNQFTGSILADDGAGLARMGVGCEYTLNNAFVEFLPANPIGGQIKGNKGLLLKTDKTVLQMCMAEEIATTLKEIRANEEKILAAMTKDVAEEQVTEAVVHMPAEAVRGTEEMIWQNDNPQMGAQMSNALTDEMLEVTRQDRIGPMGQRTEDDDIWYHNTVPLDPLLYFPGPEEMVEVTSEEARQGTEDEDFWYYNPLAIDPQLYLSSLDEMDGVSIDKVAAGD
ncbi:nadph2 dehydrogenase [Fusarium longipes]|uniref:Nadph2 dehydrogenase n=1 Tax=Fusarium longipes TaxID=694270 RepID=A0A395SNL6_9HYPO|nr:nadph2 dehydrogenase [Fusarium longipes]